MVFCKCWLVIALAVLSLRLNFIQSFIYAFRTSSEFYRFTIIILLIHHMMTDGLIQGNINHQHLSLA